MNYHFLSNLNVKGNRLRSICLDHARRELDQTLNGQCFEALRQHPSDNFLSQYSLASKMLQTVRQLEIEFHSSGSHFGRKNGFV